ncbi:hypothetical protein A7979_04730 [Rothia nasimurium]|uniref:FHA domain-containing protein n=1 Tax=Rothia nasimurium TaxID=85336 RepID=A0A1Y1RNT4_9MICC|nr:DUF3662 and FHA domain-containing protein [Rothia nasimurium]ORC15927.1 hypothetical protein A7979_04730 [Rothia nasimurium]
MGFIDRLEQGLEKAVRGTFSKGGSFEPVDIANRVRTEMDDQAFSVAEGRTIAPNIFTVQFAPTDFSRAQQWGVPLAEELCDVVVRHARTQGYSLRGAVRVTFERADDLEADDFQISSSVKNMASPQGTPAPASPRQVADAPYPAAAPASLPNRITRPAPNYAPPEPAAPAPKPQVVLEVNGERFVVRDLPVTLGRGSNADITVEDTGVSRRHLEIVQQEGTYLAVDLGSTNGSYLDGRRLQGRAELRNGSVIEMGRARIVFRLMVRKG